jgi:hypothetical protein
MNFGPHPNPPQPNTTPWIFRASVSINPKDINDKDIMDCTVYQYMSERLTRQLFESEKILKNSLRGGLSVRFEDLKLEHYDLEGRFDKAICTLTLTHRGPSRFLLETHFSFGDSLVTTATREGILYFEELN